MTRAEAIVLEVRMLTAARMPAARPRASLPTVAPRLANVRLRDVALDHLTFIGWPKVRTQLLELHGVH